MFSTPYPDIDILLHNLLSEIQKVLGDKLIGFYLYGSLVTGDFDHDVSDIDLLATLESDFDEQDFEKLKEMHENFAKTYKDWDNRIEVVYMSLEALKTFKEKTSNVLVISPGEPFHTKEVGRHWLMNWYIVREQGVTLFGPSPKTIIAPITKEEFIQSVKDHTISWNEWVKDMKTQYAQAYAILTLCRAYYAVKNGMQASKVQAAHWTEKELPEWSQLIENALIWRKTGSNKSINDEESYVKTIEFVKLVRSQILA